MAKLSLVLNLLFRTAFATIIQSEILKTFTPGDTVDFECLISGDNQYYYWYKMTIGQAPVSMVTLFSKYGELLFHGEFRDQDKTRYEVRRTGTKLVLIISDTRMSDVGMYYCAHRNFDETIFGRGVFLMHKDTRTQHLIQKPVSESVQPGDSVTLNCTILIETCSGEHSVYWFRHGSGESHPGIIYTHGDRSDQCEKSPEAGSPIQSCVYNLPKNNISLSDAGTYYCAVASCGEILFGNGTKLDVEDFADQMRILVFLSIMRTVVLLCCLVIFTIIYFIKK